MDATEAASLRGRPRRRLSEGAGLPEGVAPALLREVDGPWSEGSRLLTSDDIGIDAILFPFPASSQLNSVCNPKRNFSQISHVDSAFGMIFQVETFLFCVKEA